MQHCNYFRAIGLIVFSAGFAGCVNMEYESPQRLESIRGQLENNTARHLAIAQLNSVEKEIEATYKNIQENRVPGIYHDPDGRWGQHVRTFIGPNAYCVINFSGPIDEINYERFVSAVKRVLENKCTFTLVNLNSPGGKRHIGLKMGLTIRKYGFYTRPWVRNKNDPYGACNSACVDAFLGGVKRFSRWNHFAGLMYDTGGVALHQPKRVVAGKSICVQDADNASVHLSYQYYKKYLPGAELLLTGKLLNVNCEIIVTGEVTQKEKIWPIVYTHEFDRKWNGLFEEPADESGMPRMY